MSDFWRGFWSVYCIDCWRSRWRLRRIVIDGRDMCWLHARRSGGERR